MQDYSLTWQIRSTAKASHITETTRYYSIKKLSLKTASLRISQVSKESFNIYVRDLPIVLEDISSPLKPDIIIPHKFNIPSLTVFLWCIGNVPDQYSISCVHFCHLNKNLDMFLGPSDLAYDVMNYIVSVEQDIPEELDIYYMNRRIRSPKHVYYLLFSPLTYDNYSGNKDILLGNNLYSTKISNTNTYVVNKSSIAYTMMRIERRENKYSIGIDKKKVKFDKDVLKPLDTLSEFISSLDLFQKTVCLYDEGNRLHHFFSGTNIYIDIMNYFSSQR